MRSWLLLLPAALLASAAPLEAQKNCRKGIPCGNTCISATKTCRIGSSAAPARREMPPRQNAQASQEEGSTGDGAATKPSSTPYTRPLTVIGDGGRAEWVAHRQGAEYYRRGCAAADLIESADRLFFTTEENAQLAGYRRSPLRGC